MQEPYPTFRSAMSSYKWDRCSAHWRATSACLGACQRSRSCRSALADAASSAMHRRTAAVLWRTIPSNTWQHAVNTPPDLQPGEQKSNYAACCHIRQPLQPFGQARTCLKHCPRSGVCSADRGSLQDGPKACLSSDTALCPWAPAITSLIVLRCSGAGGADAGLLR